MKDVELEQKMSKIETVIGITKAYTTRVGGGPFPTECIDSEEKVGEDIRKEGHGQ